MSVLGLLEFGLTCFDVLAWPLFALVYPIYSSIRAIETNSMIDTQKLNTYWVIFSMILLFENAFTKLLEWFSLWLYIRLFIVFWLVIPHFDGAFYVYKNFIYPCLSMDPQIVYKWFNKHKELSEVERYVKENGYEALQKIVTGKSKLTKPNVGQKDIKAVHAMEKKIETTANQVSQEVSNPRGTEERISSMEISDRIVEVATHKGFLKTPPSKQVEEEWTCTISGLPTQKDTAFDSPVGINEHKAAYDGVKLKNETEPKFTRSSTVAVMGTQGNPVEIATDREGLEFPKKIQKEWTCSLCQVTTTCKRNLITHLEGRKHKTAYQALKSKPTEPIVGQKNNKAAHVMQKKIDTTANQVSHAASSNLSGAEETISTMEVSEKAVEVAAHRKLLKTPPLKQVKEWTCTINQLPTQTDTTFNSPLGVNEHKAAAIEGLKLNNETDSQTESAQSSSVAVMEKKGNPVETATGRQDLESPKKFQKEWTCTLCQVTTCERNLNSHLEGRKHKTEYEALKTRNQALSPKSTPGLTAKTIHLPSAKTIHLPNKEPVKSTSTSESKQKAPNLNISPTSIAKVFRLKEELEGVSNGQTRKINKKEKEKEKVQRQQQKLNEVPRTKSSPLLCEICSVRCASEIDMVSHVNGKRHKKNVLERQENR